MEIVPPSKNLIESGAEVYSWYGNGEVDIVNSFSVILNYNKKIFIKVNFSKLIKGGCEVSVYLSKRRFIFFKSSWVNLNDKPIILK